MENLVFQNWEIVKNYPAVDAAGTAKGDTVTATLNDGKYSIVRFSGSVENPDGKPFAPNARYRMTFQSRKDPEIFRQVYYNWIGPDGNSLFMGHGGPDITFVSPEGAVKFQVTLCFYGRNGGTAELSNMQLTYLGENTPRKVKLAAAMITHDLGYTTENNIAVSLARIDAAADAGADLVLLTETYNTRHVPGLQMHEGAAKQTDLAVTALAAKAKERGIYVAASIRLDTDGQVSNTLLMFDRNGQQIARYTKTHLTMSEIWSGHTPGFELPVVDTELGRIGFSICWDLFFPEPSRALFLQGVDIILNPTAGSFNLQAQAAGYANGAFIVTANVAEEPEMTRITDRKGVTIATADPEAKFAMAEVDVNQYVPVYWLSAPFSWTDSRLVFMGERRPDLYGILSDETIGYNG